MFFAKMLNFSQININRAPDRFKDNTIHLNVKIFSIMYITRKIGLHYKYFLQKLWKIISDGHITNNIYESLDVIIRINISKLPHL